MSRCHRLCALQAVLNNTLDVVRRLCETSANMLKVFPVEDRLVRPLRLLHFSICSSCGSFALHRQNNLKQLVAKLSIEAREPAVPAAFLAPADCWLFFGPQVESSPCSTSFPMGREAAHILRFVSDETVLLNSREKAPFLLLVEVRHPHPLVSWLHRTETDGPTWRQVLTEDQSRLSDAVTPALATSFAPRPEVSHHDCQALALCP